MSYCFQSNFDQLKYFETLKQKLTAEGTFSKRFAFEVSGISTKNLSEVYIVYLEVFKQEWF